MIRKFQLTSLVIFFAASLTANAAELTKQAVERLIEQVESAAQSQNAHPIAEVLSDHVEIRLNINTQGQQQALSPTKQEYIDLLAQGWSLNSNYEYRRLKTDIKITGNKATISAVVKESMEIQGQAFSVTSTEKVIVELIHNEPKITRISAYSSM